MPKEIKKNFQVWEIHNKASAFSTGILSDLHEQTMHDFTREQSGSYYTPVTITKYMVKERLKHVLEEEEEILNFKIGDIACGTGNFLVEITHYLLERGIKIEEILAMLYGIDLNPKAVELAKFRLLLISINQIFDAHNTIEDFLKLKDHPLVDLLNKNIIIRNTLIDEIDGNFDVIIGNPPYLNNKKIPKSDKIQYKGFGYSSAYKLYDLSVLFIERAHQLLKKGGELSFIITNKWVATDYGIKIRELILTQSKLQEIVNVSKLDVFKNIATYPIIISFRKGKQSENLGENKFKLITNLKTIKDFDHPFSDIQILKQQEYLDTPNYIFNLSKNAKMCTKMRKSSDTNLGKINCKWVYRPLGFTANTWKSQMVNIVTNYKKNDRDKTSLPFIGCTNIKPYSIDFAKPIRLNKTLLEQAFLVNEEACGTEAFKGPRIFIKEVSKTLTATYTNQNWAHLTGIYSLKSNDPRIIDKYLVALLNSTLIREYYHSTYGAVHMNGGYLNFHASYLKSLPIKIIPMEDQKKISIIVDYLHILHGPQDLSENQAPISYFQTLMDEIIKEIYFPPKKPLLKTISQNLYIDTAPNRLEIIDVMEKIKETRQNSIYNISS